MAGTATPSLCPRMVFGAGTERRHKPYPRQRRPRHQGVRVAVATRTPWMVSCAGEPGGPDSVLDFHQAAGFHLVDEAADRVLVRDVGAGLDPGDGLADVAFEVGKGLQGERRPDA